MHVAIAVILHPSIPEPRTLLLRRASPDPSGTVSQFAWVVPGGKCEEGEDALVALVREVEEETGLTQDRFETVTPILTEERGGITFNVYALQLPEGEINVRLSKEHDDFLWVSLQQFEGTVPLTVPEHNVRWIRVAGRLAREARKLPGRQ